METKPPMIIAILLMILGVILGFTRQLTLFTTRKIPTLINQYSDLHSSLIIIGFITILIMYERIAGLQLMTSQEGTGILKNSLVLTIAGYILYLLTESYKTIYGVYISGGILLIAGLLFIRYLTLMTAHVDKNSYHLSLISIIAYLGVIYFLVTGSKNYTSYSLLLLAYPLLFILAERIELSKFIPHKNKEILRTAPVLGGLSTVILIILNGVAYMQGTAIPAALILTTLATMYMFESINIKRLLKLGKWLMKYQAIHLTTAYLTAIAGMATYILFTLVLPELPILDIAIHLVALGFIGNMLLGHGPAVLTTIEGKNLDEERINMYPYMLLNGSLVLRVAADISKIAGISIFTQLYEISGLLIILSIPVFLVMVRKAAK